ncbi:MAG: hypothetical protein U0525_05750 [Patescibacteria group bacterium]
MFKKKFISITSVAISIIVFLFLNNQIVHADCQCGDGWYCSGSCMGYTCEGTCKPKPNSCNKCSVSCPGCACNCDGSCGDTSCDDGGGGPTRTPTPALVAPTNLRYTCDRSGLGAYIYWDPAPNASYYSLRVDNAINSWTGSCTNTNPSDVCTDVNGSSYYVVTNPYVNNNWWLHSRLGVIPNGQWSDGVYGPSFACPLPRPAPYSYMTITQSNCQLSSGDYSTDQNITFTAYSDSSVRGSPNINNTQMFIAKECTDAQGATLCSYTSSPTWCTAIGGTFVNSGTKAFCKIAELTGLNTSYTTYNKTLQMTETGTYYSLLNSATVDVQAYACSGNPKCTYSTSNLYGKYDCSASYYQACTDGSVGSTKAGRYWGESIKFEVKSSAVCIPANTPTPTTPAATCANTLPTSESVASGNLSNMTTGNAYLIDQTMPIIPNKDYTFSIDLKNEITLPVTGTLPVKLIYQGNISSGTLDMGSIPTTAQAGFMNLSTNWNSGDNTTVRIRINVILPRAPSENTPVPITIPPKNSTPTPTGGLIMFNNVIKILPAIKPAYAQAYVPNPPYSIRYKNASMTCALPTNTPTNTPTTTPTPTNTPTNTPTFTPTPTSFANLSIKGNFLQKTGSVYRASSTDNNLPFASGINVLNHTKWINGTPGPCASIASIYTDAFAPYIYKYRAPFTFPPGCIAGGVANMNIDVDPVVFSMPALYSIVGTPLQNISSPGEYTIDLPFDYNGGPWIRLKDTSFARTTTTQLVNNIPYIIDKFSTTDTDDTNKKAFIDESTAGVAGYSPDTSTVNIDPIGKTSPTNNWRLPAGYTINSSQISAKFTKFVTSLTRSKGIVSITVAIPGEDITLTSDRINVIDTTTPVSVGQIRTSITNSPAILIVWNSITQTFQNLTIRENNVGASPLIIANQIILSGSGTNYVTELKGLFVALNDINLGGGGYPLKITGNLLSGGVVTNMRTRSDNDNAKPSVFMVFNFESYAKLLKLMNANQVEY